MPREMPLFAIAFSIIISLASYGCNRQEVSELPAPYDVPDSPLLADGKHCGELGRVRVHLEDGPNGTIHVYITKGNFDPALLPEARERFDRVYRRRPGQKVITYNAQFSWKQLEEWAPQVAKAGIDRKTLGITKWTLNEQTRRITVHAVAKRNNRQRIQDFIASTAVPRDAVSLEIGCDYISSMLTQEFLVEGFDRPSPTGSKPSHRPNTARPWT